ncbi:ferrochelatase [Microbacterium fluvii]|uniref:Coproporphyrin III ferrochelatase n=1 Tax=Microbacterium fluvii TaxID=415215 RepID=A0ABW2HBT6_9MICO|nr:ferrochelatase [Microbacterium fluvii]MCU4672400.1 ferrochelatase [Microbacterium fluvii]
MSAGAYDAILLASFGGPEGQDDVIPFLRNVTRGKGIPDERLEEVAHHYRANGGVSPINQQNRDLKAALEAELEARGIDLPVVWGNRNWAPYFDEAFRELHEAGHRRVIALITSAYTSYSGVGQYREDFDRTLDETGLRDELEISRIREFFDHPGFIGPFATNLRAALDRAPEGTHVMFVTHSIPTAAAAASGPEHGEGGAYVAQHLAGAEAILREAGATDAPWSLVYQSRSGAPHIPWLEPDINDAIDELAGAVPGVIIVPFGFISDHMEVMWDLDTEAVETATGHGLHVERIPTPGVDPVFVSGLVDLVLERVNEIPHAERPHLTDLGPWPDHEPQGSVRSEAAQSA